MFIFKILLIILIALPVVGLGSYFYMQMLNYIKDKNRIEQETIRRSLEEPGVINRKSNNKNGRRSRKDNKSRKNKKKKQSEENSQQ